MQSFKNIYSGDACGHQADLDVQTLYSHQDFSNNLMSKFTSCFEILGKKFFQRWQAQVLWDDEGMTLVPSNI